MGNYAAIVKSTSPQDYQGGYKDVFLFAPVGDFLSLKKPTAPFATVGDRLKITTAHTFTAPKGFINWACKTKSVTLKSETIGDEGAQQMQHTATFVILGDGASTQDQMEQILNDNVICLIKDSNCLVTDQYVQLGDECVQPTFKVAFDSANQDGSKNYTVTVAVTGKKFFYEAAVTEAA